VFVVRVQRIDNVNFIVFENWDFWQWVFGGSEH